MAIDANGGIVNEVDTLETLSDEKLRGMLTNPRYSTFNKMVAEKILNERRLTRLEREFSILGETGILTKVRKLLTHA